MNKLIMIAAASALFLGVAGTANAIPMLQIVGSGGGAPSNPEAIGDPGGTNYANGPTTGASAGPGMPTDLGGWPNGAGFAADSSFGNALGISGYDGSYLNLTEAATVTFQFTGKGDAQDHNVFQISQDGGITWNTKWDTQSTSNGTCGTSGTSLTCPSAGSRQSFYFNAGLIDFRFINLTTGDMATNDGTNNPKDVAAGYFLGIDPYLVGGTYATTGRAAYAGFTDGPCVTGTVCDHDYEDLGVRVSVPEPGTIFLLGAGLLSFGVGRRKMAARSV